MKIFLIVICVLVGLALVGFILLIIRSRLAELALHAKVKAKIDTLINKPEHANGNTVEKIFKLAANPETRNTLYETLKSKGKEDLFPQEYYNHESFAESDLVFWLCHPNELRSPPDEIELMAKIQKEMPETKQEVTYFVFRFRVNEPHWASEYGWMAGVTGPHTDDLTPANRTPGTFSELESYESRTPEEHVEYILSKLSSGKMIR